MNKNNTSTFIVALLFFGVVTSFVLKATKREKRRMRMPYDDFDGNYSNLTDDEQLEMLKGYDIPDVEEGADMPNLTYGEVQPPKDTKASVGDIINFTVNNNTDGDMPLVSIVGNDQDRMDTANATTRYFWNITGYNITNENTVTIQYKSVGAISFSTATATFAGGNFQSLLQALNSLNLGQFFTTTSGANTYLNNYNQNVIFGTIDVTYVPPNGQPVNVINTTFAVSSVLTAGTPAIFSSQSNGQLILSGDNLEYNSVPVSYLIRLNTNGTLDTTFTGSGSLGFAIGVKVQPDDKIIGVGGWGIPYIFRTLADGSADSTFVTGTGFDAQAVGLAIQSDGKILCGGTFSTYNGNPCNCIVRLNTNGSFDSTFVTGTGFDGQINAIAIQSDGKIICAGTTTLYNGNTANCIARLNTNGSFDSTFVTGTGFDNQVISVTIQSDGKILCGGQFTSYNGNPCNGIVRLNTNGSFDSTFVTGTGFSGGYTNVFFNDIQIDYLGRIIVAGDFTSYNGNPCNNIVRLKTNGGFDATWDIGTAFDGAVISMTQSGGFIYCAGYFGTFNGQPYNRIISLVST